MTTKPHLYRGSGVWCVAGAKEVSVGYWERHEKAMEFSRACWAKEAQ